MEEAQAADVAPLRLAAERLDHWTKWVTVVSTLEGYRERGTLKLNQEIQYSRICVSREPDRYLLGGVEMSVELLVTKIEALHGSPLPDPPVVTYEPYVPPKPEKKLSVEDEAARVRLQGFRKRIQRGGVEPEITESIRAMYAGEPDEGQDDDGTEQDIVASAMELLRPEEEN